MESRPRCAEPAVAGRGPPQSPVPPRSTASIGRRRALRRGPPWLRDDRSGELRRRRVAEQFAGAVGRGSVAAVTSGTTGVQELQHRLPDGMSLEVLFRSGHEGETRPPLVFIPGSYHGAWCWEENFSPYLSQKGYDCYALSLRAQGGSDRGDLKLAGTLDSHAQDIANFVSSLGRPPVLVAHSFSGLFALRFIDGSDRNNGFPNIAGVALLCSTPPSGNGKLIGRFFRRDPLLSVQITWAFVTKSFARSLEACQQTFFSPDIPNEDLERYQAQLAACSSVPLLDIRAVNKDLPLPKPRSQLPPSFVLGGVEDRIVDREAIAETAEWLGVDPIMLDGMAHDCMLDTRWLQAVEALANWLGGIEVTKS